MTWAYDVYRRVRYNFSKLPEAMSIPSLIEFQRRSYGDFLQQSIAPKDRKSIGLQAALEALFPVSDFSGKVTMDFVDYVLEDPKSDLAESRQKGLTYAAPLRARLRLYAMDDQSVVRFSREQDVYLGDIPLMTQEGTFVVNGVERVVVSQMHRSPGVFFDHERSTIESGKTVYLGRIIPAQGSWVDFELDGRDMVYVRIDRKRKILATTLLMALESGHQEDEHASPARRLGMTRKEILDTFYQHKHYVAQDGGWRIPLDEKMWRNVRLDEDLCDADTGEVLATKGAKIQTRMLRQWAQQGVVNVLVPHQQLVGSYSSCDVIDQRTGEVLAEAGEELTAEKLKDLVTKGCCEITVLDVEQGSSGAVMRHTLMADKNAQRADALADIYRVLRPGETATLEGAYALFNNLFFQPEKYDLSEVGRLKLNSRLGLKAPLSLGVLTKEDIIAVVRYLVGLRQNQGHVDDIDSLTNRRVRSVGELLEGQYRSGLVRMQRAIRERMAAVDLETAMPNDLLNARPLSAVIREFFGTSQLSQFMEQTNPLSEVNHKRRLSALGPGGLTRDRAGIEVRDVHPTHYGRICPVETPEGANIGLINSMAIYARVNQYGFLETPYRKVDHGRLTEDVMYLSAMEEEGHTIAQADVAVDSSGRMTDDFVGCRQSGNYLLVEAEKVDFVDISPKQILSVASALIPFVENDDANRALMGSNMQRQAVPLMRAKAPLIGTGIEGLVIQDSGVIIKARRDSIIDQVDARCIVAKPLALSTKASVVDFYHLDKFRKSNAGTCIHQKPLVSVGQIVKEGDIIADGAATDRGELALGYNALVAFMSYDGCGFEDSIVLSQRLVEEDAYTSIHIDELETSVRDMKLGYEEITRDVPGASEEALRHLDEAGVAYIGAEVIPGDILVGKVSPKAEVPLTPEEKLLRAIFSDKAADMKDNSLRVPAGVSGTVVDVHIFSRRGVEKDERGLAMAREEVARLTHEKDMETRIQMQSFAQVIKELVLGQVLAQPLDSWTAGTVITPAMYGTLSKTKIKKLSLEDKKVSEQVASMYRQHDESMAEIEARFNNKMDKINKGDDLPTGVLKTVKVFLAIKRKIQPGDKMAGRHGNKGVVSVIVPEESMPFLADGTPVDVVLNPLGLPSRMNVGQILETHLGWVSYHKGRKVRALLQQAAQNEQDGETVLRDGLKALYRDTATKQRIDQMSPAALLDMALDLTKGLPMATPVFEGAKVHEIESLLSDVGVNTSGQEILYDGRTGEPFDRPITIGVQYLLKLHHLVDEKIHARSIGPYSLVTQQPLGGKSQFGGQRFGEMEVWALQAYGAARTLLEMLTFKSDDIRGRKEMYAAIIKGQETFHSDIPESFNVLIKELMTLGMSIECRQDAVVQNTGLQEPLSA